MSVRMSKAFCIFALVAGLGCSESNEVTTPPIERDPARIYARLELSYHAITLSTASGFDTMTLQVTLRTPTGTVFRTEGQDQVTTFRVSDNDPALTVTSEGFIVAREPSPGVLVIATSTVGLVTRSDTAFVRITDESAPSLLPANISIQPLPGDSARLDCSGQFADTITARGLDMDRQETGIPVFASYRSTDVTRATIDQNGIVQGWQPGEVMIHADAYMYGRGMRDSLRYTIGNPLVQAIWALSRRTLPSNEPVTYLTSSDVVIGVGGVVNWLNGSESLLDIEFDSLNAALPAVAASGWINNVGGLVLLFGTCSAQQGGNLDSLSAAPERGSFGTILTCSNVGARSFARPGIYQFRSKLTGITGRVIVQ